MSSVNFYDVLDVSQDCTSKEIKNAYRELALIFHPDKPTGDPEMFGLITDAYNVLINKASRSEYDEIYALSKQAESSHFDLKSKSKDHFLALDSDVTKKKSKGEQEIEFNKIMEDMDRKHGYKRDKTAEDPLKEKKTKKRLNDLQLARDQDDIENTHEKLFDRFDLSQFNAAFDAMHKGHTELVPHVGNPLAFNLDNGFGSNFSSIDKYEDLYIEDDALGNSDFGPVKLNQEPKKKLTKTDITKIAGVGYTTGHNYKEKDYNKSLEDKIRERELLTKKLDDREMEDFDTDTNCGGYGIFEQLGITNSGAIDWDNGEDTKTRYKKLLELRKQI